MTTLSSFRAGSTAAEPDDVQMLTFQLGSGAFAVDVRRVREVLDHKPIQPLANAPASLIGMIDVRGTGVPVMDLKRKLSLPDAEERAVGPDTRIVVLEFRAASGEERTLAVIADAVHEVADLTEEMLEAPPAIGERWNSGFMQGIGRRGDDFLTLLTVERLFDEDAAPASRAA